MKNEDFIHLHLHDEYCLSGDTVIYSCNNQFFKGKIQRSDYTCLRTCKTIKYLYEAEESRERGRTAKKYKIKVWDGENFVSSKIKRIQKSGPKQLYKITTESGKSIKASKDHLFLSDTGWRKLD